MLQIYKKKNNITNLFIKKIFLLSLNKQVQNIQCFALRLLRVGN